MQNNEKIIEGNLVDVQARDIYPARIFIQNQTIQKIEKLAETTVQQFILPGFIDAHVHIESSMLTPVKFAEIAATHGTVATVSDPHEIANVCGMEGIQFMIDNAGKAKIKIHFGAPSCVPATNFETAGAEITADDIDQLLSQKEIFYLSEVMNYPAVLNHETEMMKKLQAAKKHNKPIDGHAPGMRGEDAIRYAAEGICTDHECFTLEEALDKIKAGMKILIREGSAAKNFDALIPLMKDHPDRLMFCSDDKHPNDLMKGHINDLVKKALRLGCDFYDVLFAACVHPVLHYGLPVGLLKEGDSADFIVVSDPDNLQVLQTFIQGENVLENFSVQSGQSNINNFVLEKFDAESLKVFSTQNEEKIWAIEAHNGQLITTKIMETLEVEKSEIKTDLAKDILKIVVVNRYKKEATAAVGFIKNFGLKKGAIASTVAHDSHNIVAVGTEDDSIEKVVNSLIKSKGGLALFNGEKLSALPLPIAGLMTDESPELVAANYEKLDAAAKQLGTSLSAPFMTLSFMALLVIPELKLSDKGLFDGKLFRLLGSAIVQDD